MSGNPAGQPRKVFPKHLRLYRFLSAEFTLAVVLRIVV
jgi:hypothetical protein